MVFTFNSILRKVFPTPQMQSQLSSILECLLVLLSFLYFMLHSTKTPFETVFPFSINLETAALENIANSTSASAFSRSQKGHHIIANSHPVNQQVLMEQLLSRKH